MANRLKILRKAKGHTQASLGELVGLTHSQIQRLEMGKKNLTEPVILKLAKALDCHPGELFAPIYGDEDTDAAIRLFKDLTVEKREALLTLIGATPDLGKPAGRQRA